MVVTSSRNFEGRSFLVVFARWVALQVLYWLGVPPRVLGRLYYPALHRPAARTSTPGAGTRPETDLLASPMAAPVPRVRRASFGREAGAGESIGGPEVVVLTGASAGPDRAIASLRRTGGGAPGTWPVAGTGSKPPAARSKQRAAGTPVRQHGSRLIRGCFGRSDRRARLGDFVVVTGGMEDDGLEVLDHRPLAGIKRSKGEGLRGTVVSVPHLFGRSVNFREPRVRENLSGIPGGFVV